MDTEGEKQHLMGSEYDILYDFSAKTPQM